MIIRRKVNDGEWEEFEVEFGVYEDGCDVWDAEDDEEIECLYCSSPVHPDQYTCGRASCVGRDIEREAGWPD